MTDIQRFVVELHRLQDSQTLLKKHVSRRFEFFPPDLQKVLSETLGVADLAISSCASHIESKKLCDALSALVAASGATGATAGILEALGNDGTFAVMQGHIKRRAQKAANARYEAARAKVRELWFKLSERERATRGTVLNFATKTAPKVKDSTTSGIQKWVAEFRKESRSH